MSPEDKTSSQCIYLDDSLALARRINKLSPESGLPSHIRNLQTVLFSESAEIESRRHAYANLQRSTEPEAREVLQRFAESGLPLDEKLHVPECRYAGPSER